MQSLGTILGIWAHPDDETFSSAGIMAEAVRDGRRVVVVTATSGSGGIQDEDETRRSELAETREEELDAALAVLGVHQNVLLGYRDGECVIAPFDEAVAKLRSILDGVQPDTVLTFGPDGITGHLDHRTVSTWATTAFNQSAKPGARLYYVALTAEWVRRFLPKLEQFHLFEPGMPPPASEDELAICYTLPPNILELKTAAMKAHASQLGRMFEQVDEELLRQAYGTEYFKLAAER